MEESLGFVPSYHGHQTNFVYITWRNNLLGKIEERDLTNKVETSANCFETRLFANES